MKTSNNYSNLALRTAVAIGIGLAAFFMLVALKAPHRALTCADKQAELSTVANIATATGQVPGVVKHLPLGSQVTVRPGICK